MRSVAWVGMLACMTAAACGGDHCEGAACSAPVDAGSDAPADARAATVAGTVTDASTGAVLAGAAVTAYRPSDRAVLGTTVTASDGTYALVLPSGGSTSNGSPVDAYVGATLSGHAAAYVFFAFAPSGGLLNGDLRLLTPEAMAVLYATAGVTQDAAAGLIQVKIIGCNGACTLSATGAGTIGYGMTPSAAATTATDGVAWVFNAPSGANTVKPVPPTTYSIRFDPAGVEVFADALTTVIPNGYPD
jgi:hypothetical protein